MSLALAVLAVFSNSPRAEQIAWQATPAVVTAADSSMVGVRADSAAERPDFTGTWRLDASASDDPETVFSARRERSAERDGRRSGPASGHGHAPRGGRPEGRGGRRDLAAGERLLRGLKSDILEIRHDDPELVLVSGDGVQRRIFTDFRGSSVSASGGYTQRITTAGWEGETLVIETRSAGAGDAVIQRLRLLPSTGQLERVTELQANGDRGRDADGVRQVFSLHVP